MVFFYYCKAGIVEADLVWERRRVVRLVGLGLGHRGLHLTFAGLLLWLTMLMPTACDVQRRKSDAELGLNAQQVAGRKIYDSYCDRCHEPYSTKGKKGPGLQGVFKHQYLSLSGLPANDERVTDIIRLGRHEMPGYSQTLSQQEIEDLLAYMHTL
jgi:mono/diheme cytochrome c family protein